MTTGLGIFAAANALMAMGIARLLRLAVAARDELDPAAWLAPAGQAEARIPGRQGAIGVNNDKNGGRRRRRQG